MNVKVLKIRKGNNEKVCRNMYEGFKYPQDYVHLAKCEYRFWAHPYTHLRSYLFWGRVQESTKSFLMRKIASFIVRWYSKWNHNEITFNGNIAGGLILAHGYNITVNSRAHIGRNCVLFKGCTIGSIRSGMREGVPTLGNCVVVGLNAFVGGGVRIGNDVLISPNAFVNFDVPDHSVVIGNPGVIHHKMNATKDYVLHSEAR